MVSPCVVKHCINIGTHRFPKNEVRKSQWIQAIKHLKPGLTIRKYSYICSAHFRPADFALTPTYFKKLDRALKILKKDAIPSVFSWNKASKQQYQPPQEQHSSSLSSSTTSLSSPRTSLPSLTFDPSKVQATYSRIRPINFVKIEPFMETQRDKIEDPLLLLKQEIESQATETDMIEVPLQIFSQGTERDVLKDPQQPFNLDNVDSIIKIGMKSVQTQTQDDMIMIKVEKESVQTQTHGYSNTCELCGMQQNGISKNQSYLLLNK